MIETNGQWQCLKKEVETVVSDIPPPSDNRGAGSTIGNGLSDYPNGTKVKIIIVD